MLNPGPQGRWANPFGIEVLDRPIRRHQVYSLRLKAKRCSGLAPSKVEGVNPEQALPFSGESKD
jgi:hypothetical protein